jgi:hypothetical protein
MNSENKIPDILYKYRNWNNSVERTILKKGEIFYSSPFYFEDPLDCRIPLRYDLMTDDDIGRLTDFMELNKLNRDANIKHLKSKIQAIDLEEIKEKSFEKLCLVFGVMSLCSSNRNEHLWNKYSNKGRGFCVGFQTKNIFNNPNQFGSGGKVYYYENIPEIIPHRIEMSMVQFFDENFQKHISFVNEDEYRLTKFKNPEFLKADRKIILAREEFKEVILGYEMSHKTKVIIERIVKNTMPHVELKQAVLLEAGKIDIVPI